MKLTDAVIAFPLSAGTHEIVLEYSAPGRSLGILVGLVGLALDGLMILLTRRNPVLLPDEGDVWEVRTGMGDFNTVREALEAEGVEMLEAQLAMVPRMLNPIDAETAKKLVRLTDALEELDDVQNVFTNADFPEDFDPEA